MAVNAEEMEALKLRLAESKDMCWVVYDTTQPTWINDVKQSFGEMKVFTDPGKMREYVFDLLTYGDYMDDVEADELLDAWDPLKFDDGHGGENHFVINDDYIVRVVKLNGEDA